MSGRGLVVADLKEPIPCVVFVDEDGKAVVWCFCGCDTWLQTDYSPAWLEGWKVYASDHGGLGAEVKSMYGRRYER